MADHVIDFSIESFTKSIAFAPIGSKELSLGYANRSVVLLKSNLYENCLLDIEQALKTGYPDNLKAKLFIRQMLCFHILKPHSKLESSISYANVLQWLPKMNKNNKNPNVIGASDAIDVKYTKKLGHHVVATRDIKTGEFIFIKNSFASMVLEEKRYSICWHCFKDTYCGVPCDYCPNLIYCSLDCKETAWHEYHDIECEVLTSLLENDRDIAIQLSVKIFIKLFKSTGSLIELKKYIDRIESSSSSASDNNLSTSLLDTTNYESFHNLIKHLPPLTECISLKNVGIMTATAILLMQPDILGTNLTSKEWANNKWIPYTAGLLLKYKFIFDYNFLANADIFEDDYTNKLMVVEPMIKVFRHSCNPNANDLIHQSTTSIFATKPIKKGEEVFTSWGVDFFKSNKQERQNYLLPILKNICQCEACKNDYPSFDELPEYINVPRNASKKLKMIKKKILEYVETSGEINKEKLIKAVEDACVTSDIYNRNIDFLCHEIIGLPLVVQKLYHQIATRNFL
ncbi:SET and MYND domain-containing protein 4-like [Aphidius gifuensis]|uniref:SET and MYND domain-containing protein 4-like n=1 Tax=Aphidius gifuensis TaxID=684658 RepID=UPI001CDBB1BF|nr:SET and MYND domain-containing protein 4-like [Aphidius gifuensis]